MFLGLDIGSSSSKAVIMDQNKEIVAMHIINTGTGTDGPEKVVEEVLKKLGITWRDVPYSVVTGYGRITYEKADKQVTEISCHGKGAAYLMPNVRTVIDIGGQDAKVIRLDENGRVENFVMNDKCAAGTGRFLEVMARILDCKIDELSALAENATEAIHISNTCTVFAESEVISQLAAGAKKENVAKGAHMAVAKRIAGLTYRIGVKPNIVMTGGVALNKNFVLALENEMNQNIVVVKSPQIVGAIGAALYAYEMSIK
jgi:predicted CoA-substrate-specific enzyme activase